MEIPVLVADEKQWLRRSQRIVLRCIKRGFCPASKLDKTTSSSRPSSLSSPPQLAAHDITNHHHRLRGLAKPSNELIRMQINKLHIPPLLLSTSLPVHHLLTGQRNSLYTPSQVVLVGLHPLLDAVVVIATILKSITASIDRQSSST